MIKLRTLNIILLGSFYPPEEELRKAYDSGEPDYLTKFNDKKELLPLEKLFLIEKMIKDKYSQHKIIILKKRMDGNIVLQELTNLLKADLIILLFSDKGGVVGEHTLCCFSEQLKSKTENLICSKEKSNISKLYTQGTFCLPGVKVKEYNTDDHLIELVFAIIDSYQAIDELAAIFKS